MVTIIFIADNGEPVTIKFSRNEELNGNYEFGKWNIITNSIELNEDGWKIFENYRQEIRKLKPLLSRLIKVSA